MKGWFIGVCVLAGIVGLLPTARAQTGQQEDLASVPRISQADFLKLAATGRVLILDVRDAASYTSGHIPGAISIPLADVPSHAARLKAETRPIVAYCA